ncbi:MAG TPA: PQQ-dependent sugar dehydrogenase, partial [Mycobacteriales bacterium]|nr:PQQ-dependent sugar dehydrogenase [Mycobacteriales bacterium]
MRRLPLLTAVALLVPAVACSSDGGKGSGSVDRGAGCPAGEICATGSPAGSPTGGTASRRATGTPSRSAPATTASSPPSSRAATPTAEATRTAAAREGEPRLERVAKLSEPVFLTSPPGDPDLYVVEQRGTVRVVSGGRLREEPFLDISADVRGGGEQGLLSIAFSPRYAEDRLLYAYYTDDNGDSRVVELRAEGDRVDPASRRELMKIGQPYPNHNGGLLLFDPKGMLLIGLGDGGSGGDPENRGQDLGDPLGKILRIDPQPDGDRPYGVPRDNPFVGREGVRPEIWAYGLRNPWRFSFDRRGTLYLADVGQGDLEEIDVVPAAKAAGANYGWSVFEGDRKFKEAALTPGGELVSPALTYGHDNGRCSVTGGHVYTGTVKALAGSYV